MSAALDVLRRAQAAGVSLAADGGQLRLKASKEPPRELLDELRVRKPELLALLSSSLPAGNILADGDTGPSFKAWVPPSPLPFNIDEAAARITSWLDAIRRLPRACGSQGTKLKAITTDFASGPWSYPAIQCGWSDVDLFALDGGLIPEMTRRALHFRTIDSGKIILINGRGEFEEWERKTYTTVNRGGTTITWWTDFIRQASFPTYPAVHRRMSPWPSPP